MCDGPTRNVKQWKQVFQEWTCNVKRKARNIYMHQIATGGGLPVPNIDILTDLEERLLQMLAKVAVTGMEIRELGLTKEQKCVIKKNKKCRKRTVHNRKRKYSSF